MFVYKYIIENEYESCPKSTGPGRFGLITNVSKTYAHTFIILYLQYTVEQYWSDVCSNSK